MLAEAKNSKGNQLENILILDTETGGLDPRIHSLLEIGVIVYNIPTHTIIMKTQGLLYAELNAVEHINKISAEWCKQVKVEIQASFFNLINFCISHCDLVIAHNASFDKGFIESNELLKQSSKNAVWACTKNDFNWPTKQRSLQALAEYYGVDYLKAHRALADCEILLQVMQKNESFFHELENLYFRKIGSF